MLNKETIRQIALDNGFKLKEQPDGSLDLNPYVYDTINKAIEVYESEKTNGWISVDDELPSENQLVLLFDNFGEQTIGKIIKKGNAHNAHNYTLRAIDDEFIFWLITTTDDYHYGTYHDIALISDFAYWQPLPQPPKE